MTTWSREDSAQLAALYAQTEALELKRARALKEMREPLETFVEGCSWFPSNTCEEIVDALVTNADKVRDLLYPFTKENQTANKAAVRAAGGATR